MTTVNIPAPSHPGIYLEGMLTQLGLSQSELARASGIGFQRINGIVCGRRSISTDSALRIAQVLGIEAGTILSAQNMYDLYVTRKRIASALKKIKPLDV